MTVPDRRTVIEEMLGYSAGEPFAYETADIRGTLTIFVHESVGPRDELPAFAGTMISGYTFVPSDGRPAVSQVHQENAGPYGDFRALAENLRRSACLTETCVRKRSEGIQESLFKQDLQDRAGIISGLLWQFPDRSVALELRERYAARGLPVIDEVYSDTAVGSCPDPTSRNAMDSRLPCSFSADILVRFIVDKRH